MHASNKQLENEIKEMIPYTTALKKTELGKNICYACISQRTSVSFLNMLTTIAF